MTSVGYTEPGQELLPIATAASMLGVSVDTLRRWEREGRIQSERTLGGHRRFTRASVDAVRAGAA